MTEDNGAAAVQQHTMLRMPVHRPGKDNVLDILSQSHEGVAIKGVVDPNRILLDDGSIVEISSDVVRGRADDLHAPVVCLVIRAGALEAGEERVVVDAAGFELSTEIVAEDLHMSSEHQQLGAGVREPAKAAPSLALPCRHLPPTMGIVVGDPVPLDETA